MTKPEVRLVRGRQGLGWAEPQCRGAGLFLCVQWGGEPQREGVVLGLTVMSTFARYL